MNLSWLLVGAVYGFAVSLVRRAGIELPKKIATLFYGLVILFLFRPLTGPYVSIATDIEQLLPPWSASAPPGLSKYTVSNIETQDVVMQLVPGRIRYARPGDTPGSRYGTTWRRVAIP